MSPALLALTVAVPALVALPLALLPPKYLYKARQILYVATLFFIAIWGPPIGVVMTLLGRHYDVNMVVQRMYYYFGSTIMDIHVDVEGLEYLQEKEKGGSLPAVLMCNHQSFVDLIAVGR